MVSEREVVELPIKLVEPGAKLPTYAHEGDACMDVYASANSTPSRGWRGATLDMLPLRVDDCGSYLCRDEDWLLEPNSTTKVSLGFSVAVPDGWELQVRSRSGLALKGISVANGVGTVDASYRGLMCVLLRNNLHRAVIVRPGDKIAQICLKRAPKVVLRVVDELDTTERGQGGFGSTGVR